MPRSWLVTVASACALVAASTAAFAASDFQRIKIGRAIAPVPLDLAGKSRRQVWYGSYVGLPAGLTEDEFIELLRTGLDEDGNLLQVMPWPVYGKMTKHDLRAVYAYLSAIPSCDAEVSAATR